MASHLHGGGAEPGNALAGLIDATGEVAGDEDLGMAGKTEVGLDDEASGPVGFGAEGGVIAGASTPAAQTTLAAQIEPSARTTSPSRGRRRRSRAATVTPMPSKVRLV